MKATHTRTSRNKKWKEVHVTGDKVSKSIEDGSHVTHVLWFLIFWEYSARQSFPPSIYRKSSRSDALILWRWVVTFPLCCSGAVEKLKPFLRLQYCFPPGVFLHTPCQSANCRLRSELCKKNLLYFQIVVTQNEQNSVKGFCGMTVCCWVFIRVITLIDNN